MSITNLTAEQLRRAADIQEQIQQLQAEIAGILGESVGPSVAGAPSKRGGAGKRRISAAGKARIAAAARARWARERAKKAALGPGAVPKRKLSPAARRKLAAIAKARWARAKAAGKSKL